ncbi:hypothetical protein [Leifsonia sp. AG29]|uniref:hypothetical protein n=1 Tax=Leifsonia sp. AG29 TaxID=2598860 RepID=UPI00131CA374|nr:hypothetical protein [Leifsonia sp. AG29]
MTRGDRTHERSSHELTHEAEAYLELEREPSAEELQAAVASLSEGQRRIVLRYVRRLAAEGTADTGSHS